MTVPRNETIFPSLITQVTRGCFNKCSADQDICSTAVRIPGDNIEETSQILYRGKTTYSSLLDAAPEIGRIWRGPRVTV